MMRLKPTVYIVRSGDKSVEITSGDALLACLEALDLHGFSLPITATPKGRPNFSATMAEASHVEYNRKLLYDTMRTFAAVMSAVESVIETAVDKIWQREPNP